MADQDFGLAISNPGIDVTQAGPYDYIFNSGWPSVSIAYDETFTVSVPAFDFKRVQFQHNLGFYPFAMAYCFKNDVYVGRADIGQGIGVSNIFFYIGKDSFYFSFTGDTTDATYRINVKAYNVDLQIKKDYPFIKPPAISQSYNPDFGIKIAKENKEINSKDLRDFVIHSRAQSPAILSVITQDSAVSNSGTKTISYTNPGGYIAWIYGFVGGDIASGLPEVYSNARFAVQTAVGVRYSGNTFFLQFLEEKFATLIVLRDPLFAANTIGVKYG